MAKSILRRGKKKGQERCGKERAGGKEWGGPPNSIYLYVLPKTETIERGVFSSITGGGVKWNGRYQKQLNPLD